LAGGTYANGDGSDKLLRPRVIRRRISASESTPCQSTASHPTGAAHEMGGVGMQGRGCDDAGIQMVDIALRRKAQAGGKTLGEASCSSNSRFALPAIPGAGGGGRIVDNQDEAWLAAWQGLAGGGCDR
jgi:hypothetical protein